jgi:Fur family peroxide stress response transcriptional regulator
MNNYIDILRAHNLKATPQRIEIANSLHNKGHMTIENLYEVLHTKFQNISLATIYKNINIMIESAFVQEVKIPNAKSVYEISKATHAHLVCKECSDIEDVTLNLTSIIDEASNLSHYNIQKVDLVFSGVCKNCQ